MCLPQKWRLVFIASQSTNARQKLQNLFSSQQVHSGMGKQFLLHNRIKLKTPWILRSRCFSVSKKTNNKFRHAGRLLRNGAEFRILWGKMYEGTSTEQKVKNAKSGLDSMSKPLLQSLHQRNALPPPFTQRRLNFVCLFYKVCFSPLYRQSEPP